MINTVFKAAALALLCSFSVQSSAFAYTGERSAEPDSSYARFSGSLGTATVENAPCAIRTINDISGIGSASRARTGSASVSDILSYFRESTESFAEVIDVSRFDIKLSDETPEETGDKDSFFLNIDKEAKQVYELLVYYSPRSYYLMKSNGTYSYNFLEYEFREGDGTYLAAVAPVYALDIYDGSGGIDRQKLDALLPEIESEQSFFDSEIARITSYIDRDLSDPEKLLALQYALTLRYYYSMEEFQKPFDERKNNTALELLKTRKGLCTAFSILFNYLAMELGLPDTGFVTSRDINGNDYHTWNLVKAATAANGGTPRWYHVDTAWSNTQNDGYGCTYMEYFLLDTETISKTHNIYENGEQKVFAPSEDEIAARLGENTANTYSGSLWHKSATMLVPYADKWYFIARRPGTYNTSALYEFDPLDPDGEYKELYVYDDVWSCGGIITWRSFTGLGAVNGVLYFNGPKSICGYNIASGKVETIYTPELDAEHSIFSCYITGNTLYYGINGTTEPTALPEIVPGGSYALTDVSVSEAYIDNGVLSFTVDTYAGGDSESVTVSVRSGDSVTTGTHAMPNSGAPSYSADLPIPSDSMTFSVPVEECSVPTIYVWNDEQTPYITSFCIDNNVYIHDGKGGSAELY